MTVQDEFDCGILGEDAWRRVDLTFRETMQVVAALHYWQENHAAASRTESLKHFFYEADPFSAEGIEAVCDRILDAWTGDPNALSRN